MNPSLAAAAQARGQDDKALGHRARGKPEVGAGRQEKKMERLLFRVQSKDQNALIQRLAPEPSDSHAEGGAALLLHPRPLGTALGGGCSVREAPPREGGNPRATVGDCAPAGGWGWGSGEHREHPHTSARWSNGKPRGGLGWG